MTSPALESLFDRIDLTPVGPEERALIAEAIRLAEEEGDDAGVYAARMRLTSSAHMSGDSDALFSSFAWCIARNEQDPQRFPQQVASNDLLFQYKWMAGRLSSNPAFALAEVDALTADMSRRYREAGVSQSGVLQSRVSTSILAGDLDAAVAAQRERDLIPRDDYSHCEACVRSTDAWLAQLRGDGDEALRLFDEIIAQGLSCGEEPEAAQGEALLALLRAGRIDDAVHHHRAGYRAARALPDGFSIIADHLVFCAVTGNTARGLAILERHLPELGRDPLDRAATLSQLVAVGVLLDSVVRDGQGDAVVAGSGDPRLADVLERPAGVETVTELAASAWRVAETIAVEFDARNGNDFFARRIASGRALADERFDVPLEIAVFAPTAPEAPAEPSDASGWLARARDTFAGDLREAADAVARGLAMEPDTAVAADLHALRVAVAFASDDAGERDAALADRADALRADGREATAELEMRIGALLYGQVDADDLAVLRAEEARIRDLGPAGAVDLGRVLTAIGDAHAAAGDYDAALGVLTAAVELIPDVPQDGRRANVQFRVGALLAALGRDDEGVEVLAASAESTSLPHSVRARLLDRLGAVQLERGEADAAVAAGEDALRAWIATGDAESTVGAAVRAAAAWSALDRDDEAASRVAYAIRTAERAELPTDELRFHLGRYQLWAGAVDDARETLEDLYRSLGDDVPPAFTATVLYFLGEVAYRQGDPGVAFGAWTDAIGSATQADDHALAARVGIRLGQLLKEFEDEDAVEVLDAALQAARTAGDTALIVDAQHLRGRFRVAFGDEQGLDDLDTVLEIARAEGADWLAADVTDSRARALVELERLDEALEAFTAAADGYTVAGDLARAAGSSVAAGRALVVAERPEEAVVHYRTALAIYPVGSGAHTSLSLELADLLEGLGRLAEARELRDAAQ